MISKKLKLNLFFFIVLLSGIFFYSYYISQNKGSIKIINSKSNVQSELPLLERGMTKFTDVEYKTLDKKNNIYITKGREAFLSKKKPDIIELVTVHSFTKLKDGTTLNIKSDRAQYFTNSKNIKYYNNVVIENKKIIITSGMAHYNSDKNQIKLEKNVFFKSEKINIEADVATLNTISNNLEIFMVKKEDKVHARRK